MERVLVEYRGRVQGVGFRAITRDIAENFDVAGYVQNLANGSVRVVAEGETEVLTEFTAAIHRRLGRYIAGEESVAGPATGEFEDFEIR